MSAPTKVMLIACGSYNPVTNMHLRMFELARDALNRTGRYSVIGGIISPASDAYEKKDLVLAKHRCAMLRLALKGTNWVHLDSWECSLPHWSRTQEVLSHHLSKINRECNANTKPTSTKKRRKDQKNESINEDEVDHAVIDNNCPRIIGTGKEAVGLKLLCGADLLESFAVPGLWSDDDIEDIVSRFGLVCITRSGSDPKKFIYESDVLTKYQENIHIVPEWIQNEISATRIRRALRRGESVKYLLQDSVIDYIREHQLYGYGVTDKAGMSGLLQKALPVIDDLPDRSKSPKGRKRQTQQRHGDSDIPTKLNEKTSVKRKRSR